MSFPGLTSPLSSHPFLCFLSICKASPVLSMLSLSPYLAQSFGPLQPSSHPTAPVKPLCPGGQGLGGLQLPQGQDHPLSFMPLSTPPPPALETPHSPGSLPLHRPRLFPNTAHVGCPAHSPGPPLSTYPLPGVSSRTRAGKAFLTLRTPECIALPLLSSCLQRCFDIPISCSEASQLGQGPRTLHFPRHNPARNA